MEVIIGKSFVRVRHEGVTKGALVEHIISHYNERGGVDFILCLGDDRMDERMFAILRDYQHGAQYRVVQVRLSRLLARSLALSLNAILRDNQYGAQHRVAQVRRTHTHTSTAPLSRSVTHTPTTAKAQIGKPLASCRD